jgi:hypothetical protein
MYNSWFEAESRAKDFRDLKHEFISPLFMSGMIKGSPCPPNSSHIINHHHTHSGHTNGNYNITVNYNDFSNRMVTPVHMQ